MNEHEPIARKCSEATREDRRGTPRERTLLKAHIVLQSGREVPCIICDASQTGLKLCVDSLVDLPETFALHVSQWEQDLDCELRWRSGETVGVEFGHRTLQTPPECMAFIIAADDGEHHAASKVLKRYGYLVHRARSISLATSSISAMGSDHPLLRREHLLFIVMEESDNQAELRAMCDVCHRAFIMVASDDADHGSEIADLRVPRGFMARQLIEALDCLAEIELKPLRLARFNKLFPPSH